MMMTLGLYVFMLNTLPYQSLARSVNYNLAENKRVGKRPVTQFLGVGQEEITLIGELRPEITGGIVSLLAFETMANMGRAWPLIEGSGFIYGMFIIKEMTHTNTQFFPDGRAQSISFTLKLKRVDESYSAMFGDINQQAGELLNKASDGYNKYKLNGMSII